MNWDWRELRGVTDERQLRLGARVPYRLIGALRLVFVRLKRFGSTLARLAALEGVCQLRETRVGRRMACALQKPRPNRDSAAQALHLRQPLTQPPA